jgi:hypothetical protein
MDKKQDQKSTELQEQDAPLKNTDNAYVKVGEDGKPHMPEEDSSLKEAEGENKNA